LSANGGAAPQRKKAVLNEDCHVTIFFSPDFFKIKLPPHLAASKNSPCSLLIFLRLTLSYLPVCCFLKPKFQLMEFHS